MKVSIKHSIKHSIKYGQDIICFDLCYSKRKSLVIEVRPDMSVVVKAPTGYSQVKIDNFVIKRLSWIKKKIEHFKKLPPPTPPREYVEGESHLYLGRSYQLQVQESKNSNVELQNGYFQIACPRKNPKIVKSKLDLWYMQKCDEVIRPLLLECWPKMNLPQAQLPNLRFRKLKSKWGSLSAKGEMTLNSNLIRAPKDCIEYVIFHELCHLVHFNHSKKFYTLFAQKVPDWKEKKRKLENLLR